MNIKTSPAPFASAVEPLLYTLEGLDPDTTTLVEIVNADNNSTLGTLRLRGLDSRSIDVAPYLRRHFALNPVANSATYAISHPASIVSCYIRCGEVQSATLHAVLAAPRNAPLVPNTLLSDMPLRRSLAAGESDDLRLISEDGTVACNLLLHDIEGGTTPYTISTEERELMVGVVVDFDSLQALVSAPLSCIEATLLTSAGEVATVIYDIVERGTSAHRVAWFNGVGACDQHTFEGFGGRKVSFERSRIAGAPDLITSRRTTLTLDSGVITRADMEALLSLLSSPAVWIFDGGRLRRVEVVTKEHTTQDGARPDRVIVQLSYVETVSRTA